MSEENKQPERPKPTFSQSQIRDGMRKFLGINNEQQPPQKFQKTLAFLNRKSPITETTSPGETKPGGV